MSKVRAAAGRSYPVSKASGSQEETPRVGDQGRWPGGAIPRPRSWVVGRRHPASKVRDGGKRHLAPEARGGDPEEPPRARGQGRQLGGATHTQGQG